MRDFTGEYLLFYGRLQDFTGYLYWFLKGDDRIEREIIAGSMGDHFFTGNRGISRNFTEDHEIFRVNTE